MSAYDALDFYRYEWSKRTKLLLLVMHTYLDNIQIAPTPLKKSEEIKIYLYDHFKTSWIIQNDDQTVTLFDIIFLGKYNR